MFLAPPEASSSHTCVFDCWRKTSRGRGAAETTATLQSASDSPIMCLKTESERVDLSPVQGSSVGTPGKGLRLGSLPASPHPNLKSTLPRGPTIWHQQRLHS